MYGENYKTLMKESKDDKNSWRDIPCPWIGRIAVMKIAILPKAIYRFNAISIILPMVFLTELEQKFSQFGWKHTRPLIDKTVFIKRNCPQGINLPDHRL